MPTTDENAELAHAPVLDEATLDELMSRVDEEGLETLAWVHWFDEDRLHSHCDDVPPAEHEAAFYAAQQTTPTGIGNQ